MIIQETMTYPQVLKRIRDKHEGLQCQRSGEEENLAFAGKEKFYKQQPPENDGKNGGKGGNNAVAGLIIYGKCKRLRHGKSDAPNCHRCGGASHCLFECRKSSALAANPNRVNSHELWRGSPPIVDTFFESTLASHRQSCALTIVLLSPSSIHLSLVSMERSHPVLFLLGLEACR